MRNIHPDIIVVGILDEKHIVTVDQIREVKKDVYILPNEANQKAYIISDADSMNINAQNALLQILEEPPKHDVFILCTENPAALLPTVRSRCVELGVQPINIPAHNTDHALLAQHTDLMEFAKEFVAALAYDNVKLMECMFRLDKLDRNAFSDFLTFANENVILSLRKHSKSEYSSMRKALAHAENVLAKAAQMLELNVSSGHIAGYICANAIKTV
jgi:DNA polymerase III delta prime subunit